MCGRFPEAPVILDHVGRVRLRGGPVLMAEPARDLRASRVRPVPDHPQPGELPP